MASPRPATLFEEKWDWRALSRDRLKLAVQQHAGYVVSDTEPPGSLADQLAKVATMRLSKGPAESRVEAIAMNLEGVFVHSPQADAICRATWCVRARARRIHRYIFQRVVLPRGTRGWYNRVASLNVRRAYTGGMIAGGLVSFPPRRILR